MVWVARLSSGRVTRLLAHLTEALQNNHCGEDTAAPFTLPGSPLTNAEGMFSGRGNHWLVGLVQRLQPRASDATNCLF